MPHRYLLAGARGGQGTTTVATVLALLSAGHRPTALATAQVDDVCALTGIPRPGPSSTTAICPNLTLAALRPSHVRDLAAIGAANDGQEDRQRRYGELEVSVVDLGRLGDEAEPPPADGAPHVVRWLVVRGPCYLSLRAAVEHCWQPDGVILLAEPGRSLSSADVADVLGAPVVGRVPVEPAAARVIDAGLLLGRLHRLSAFRSLAQLVRAPNGYGTPPTTPAAL
jgi:hypothetical protein